MFRNFIFVLAFNITMATSAFAETVTTLLQGFNQPTFALFLSESGAIQIGNSATTMNTIFNGGLPKEGLRFLNLRQFNDVNGDQTGFAITFTELLKSDVFKIYHRPERLEEFGALPRDAYKIDVTPVSSDGGSIGITTVIAEGTSDLQNNDAWQLALYEMPFDSNLRVRVTIRHLEGATHTLGKRYRHEIDAAMFTRTTTPVPLPPSLLLFGGAGVALVGVCRRKV